MLGFGCKRYHCSGAHNHMHSQQFIHTYVYLLRVMFTLLFLSLLCLITSDSTLISASDSKILCVVWCHWQKCPYTKMASRLGSAEPGQRPHGLWSHGCSRVTTSPMTFTEQILQLPSRIPESKHLFPSGVVAHQRCCLRLSLSHHITSADVWWCRTDMLCHIAFGPSLC